MNKTDNYNLSILLGKVMNLCVQFQEEGNQDGCDETQGLVLEFFEKTGYDHDNFIQNKTLIKM